MRAILAGSTVEEVERIGKEREWEEETTEFAPHIQFIEIGLVGRGPGLVILHVAVVGMMSAMRDSPSVVRDHD